MSLSTSKPGANRSSMDGIDGSRQLLSPPTHPEMLGRLGRYEIETTDRSGGMGVVFKSVRHRTESPRRHLPFELRTSSRFLVRFERRQTRRSDQKVVARMQPAPEVTAFASVLIRSLLNGTPRRYDREGHLGARLFAGRSCFSFFCPPFSCPRFP